MRLWQFPEQSQPLAVVAHDAGAANLIAAALRAGNVQHRALVAGPAAQSWSSLPQAVLASSLEVALDGAALVLTGTGWASDLEHEARKEARARGLASIAVIDHWANYRERFQRHGEEVLPNEIWVMDAYAEAEVRRVVSEVPARKQPNIYLREQALAASPRPANGDLLFVAEPARSDWGQGTSGEFQTLDYLAAHRDAAGVDKDAILRIRVHPSDPPGKYDAWIAAHPGSQLDRSSDMTEALAGASWVAGLQSFALVIALEAGRPAICALPPHAPACRLPHKEIMHLRQMAEGAGKSHTDRFE